MRYDRSTGRFAPCRDAVAAASGSPVRPATGRGRLGVKADRTTVRTISTYVLFHVKPITQKICFYSVFMNRAGGAPRPPAPVQERERPGSGPPWRPARAGAAWGR